MGIGLAWPKSFLNQLQPVTCARCSLCGHVCIDPEAIDAYSHEIKL